VYFSENGKNLPVQLDPLVRTGYNSEPLYPSSTGFSNADKYKVKLLGLAQRVLVDVCPTAWLNIILIKEHCSLLMDYL
jgi:hypothetical protein